MGENTKADVVSMRLADGDRLDADMIRKAAARRVPGLY